MVNHTIHRQNFRTFCYNKFLLTPVFREMGRLTCMKTDDKFYFERFLVAVFMKQLYTPHFKYFSLHKRHCNVPEYKKVLTSLIQSIFRISLVNNVDWTFFFFALFCFQRFSLPTVCVHTQPKTVYLFTILYTTLLDVCGVDTM